MITLQLKTTTGAVLRAYFSGTYSNAVDKYLGKTIDGAGIVSEVFEIPTTEPEQDDEQ
jgi:hypothetical protein